MKLLQPPKPETGFIILPPPYIRQEDLFQIGFYGRPKEYSDNQYENFIGCIVGAHWADEEFAKKRERISGRLQRRNFNHFTTLARLDIKAHTVRSAETNLKSKLTRLTNEYNKKADQIEKSNSIFKADELAKLTKSYETACQKAREEYSSPEYQEMIQMRKDLTRSKK
jgi:hypothetical protein